MTSVDALAEVAQTIPKPIHGGFGDRALHIIQGTPLGQKGREDSSLVQQDVFDVSSGDVRYNFALPTEFYKPSTGATEVRPGIEMITYIGDRGVIVVDPTTGRTSDILQLDAFVMETKKTSGLFSFDMNTARHTLSEGNPVIMAMAKDALRKTITMLGTVTPGPEGALADMGVFTQRRNILKEKLKSLE